MNDHHHQPPSPRRCRAALRRLFRDMQRISEAGAPVNEATYQVPATCEFIKPTVVLDVQTPRNEAFKELGRYADELEQLEDVSRSDECNECAGTGERVR